MQELHERIQNESQQELAAMVRRAIATYGQHEPQEPQEAQATPAPEGARDDWWQQGGDAAQGAAWGEWQGGGESPDQAGDHWGRLQVQLQRLGR